MMYCYSIGATGATLNDDDTNLYISRDGGTTWHEVIKLFGDLLLE